MPSPSVALLEICVPSAWFLRNNVKKVQNGDDARSTVVFAQGAKIAEAVQKYHEKSATSASEAYNIFGKYAEKSKALNFTGRGIDWAAKHVNLLIGLSALYKTAKSENKVETGITQLGALSGMFVGEGLMKLNKNRVLNEQNVTKVLEKVKDTKVIGKTAQKLLKSGAGGKIAAVLQGISFVLVSMGSYSAGEKLAQKHSEKICSSLGVKTKDETIQEEETPKIDQLA